MNPVEAANILLTIWDVLYRVTGTDPDKPTSTVGGPVPPREPDTDRVERDYEAMQERVDRLVLLTHAMYTLVSEKMGITDAELVKRMADLDASDGTVDGRVTAPPIKCSCGAMVSRKFNRCLFCGKKYDAGSAFDTV